jgi:predicted dehydrogenase
MTEHRIKIGVIGVGSIGQWHARIYSELPDAELVGVYDINRPRAEEIAARYKTRPYFNQAELAEDVEAASVVVPADKHFEAAAMLLERGIHVLVEKPIATNMREAGAMVEAARKNNCVLQAGHVERFNPVMGFLEGVLTHPRFIEAHRLAPYPPSRPGQPPRGTEVSVVLDLMIHDLEIILHLVRSPVQSIHAVGVPVLSGSEDIANARISFQNGCVANVTTSRISPEAMRKIRVFQEDAYISLDYQKQAGEIYRKNGGKIERNKVPIEKGDALTNELASFVNCVKNHGDPVVSGTEAAQALMLADEICRHIKDHSS